MCVTPRMFLSLERRHESDDDRFISSTTAREDDARARARSRVHRVLSRVPTTPMTPRTGQTTVNNIIKILCDRHRGRAIEGDDEMKRLKRIVRQDDRAMEVAHDALRASLKARHAGTRRRAIEIMNELFTRSSFYRELVVRDIEHYLKYAIGVDDDAPLPDEPRGEAERLRHDAVNALEGWENKFTSNEQLKIARKFAIEKLGEDAPEAKAAKMRRVAEEKEHKVQRNLRERWLASRDDANALVVEIHSTLAAARECFRLLFNETFVDDFDDSVNHEDGYGKHPRATTAKTGGDDEWEDVDDGAVREWPVIREEDTSEDGTIALRETSENAPILEQLRGLYRSTKARYVPRLTETLEILGRLQPDGRDESIGVTITQDERSRMVNVAGELKQRLHALVQRCEALRLIQGANKDSNAPNANAKANATNAECTSSREDEEDGAENRRGASQRAVDALLARASKRRKRSATAIERSTTVARVEDIKTGARKMLASEIKAHNDDVLAEMGRDFFEVERERQYKASEALANDLIEDEIDRHKALTARGKTARERIENSLRGMRSKR